jgi:ORF6N domain
MTPKLITIPAEAIESSILLIRGREVILDRTLSKLYGVSTRVLRDAVRRNPTRFPPDFMFQLRMEEMKTLEQRSRSQKGQGKKDRPYAFTEHGVLTFSSVLIGERVAHVNIEIMRTFVRLRETPASNAELTKRLDVLEHNYEVVFKAMRKPMRLATPRQKPIGFRANSGKR